MRFFTEHFFSEEQKVELLGDRYEQSRHGARQAEHERRCVAFEVAQTRERLQREQDEFDRKTRLVELTVLPLILAIMLACGLVSYALGGTI